MAEDTKGQVEKLLTELGKKIDHLIEEAKKAGTEVSKDVEEKIADLKVKKEKLEADFEEFKDKNEDKWKDAVNHLDAAAGELRKAVQTVFNRKS